MSYRLPTIALVAAAWVGACESTPSPEARANQEPGEGAPVAAPGQSPQVQPTTSERAAQATRQAEELVRKLGSDLKGRLQAAMKEGGPEAAIRICADHAQAITAAAQPEGARVGRASLRLRNPNNAGPDWVRAWLVEQGDRAAAGVEGIETVAGGHLRLLRPIPVEGVCITCHGPREALPQGVQLLLANRYPEDRAVGYAPGELRGAIWAEVRLDTH